MLDTFVAMSIYFCGMVILIVFVRLYIAGIISSIEDFIDITTDVMIPFYAAFVMGVVYFLYIYLKWLNL